MASAVDRGLLAKCEEFLLHPTVRALSLAQRVDFLEKKGLSPEQITRCLTSVERRNGLAQLAQRTAEQLAASSELALPSEGAPDASRSLLTALKLLVKKYGAVSLLLLLLSYGYVQLRTRKAEQLALTQQTQRVQRRARMSVKVEALLGVVRDQQKQYNEAAQLLERRTQKFLEKQHAAHSQEMALKANSSATQFTKGIELQALQSELMELKSVVVDRYLHPPDLKQVVKKAKEMPMVLRPAEPNTTDGVSEESGYASVKVAAVVSSSLATRDSHPEAKKTMVKNKQSKEMPGEGTTVRDQTALSAEEITELLEGAEFEEELSTARSYRLLFATE